MQAVLNPRLDRKKCAKTRYPELVTKLTTVCDGWIIGSGAESNTPHDYDVFIPLSKWREACAIIPSDARVNKLGGFKCISENIEVDIWTGEMNNLLASHYFKCAYHPQTGVKIIRENHF